VPTVVKLPRKNHLDLAQRILEVARQQGMRPGAHLPEQQLATLCSVSRTPIRAALKVLADQGVVSREDDAGYRLAVDLSSPADFDSGLPRAEEATLADAILRDRAARRLAGTITVPELMRRYSADRRTVLKAAISLTDDGILQRAPGQSWIFRPIPDSPQSIAASFEYRLLLEPAAILVPGFQLDGVKAAALRQGMEALLSRPDSEFDTREFHRLDIEFHRLIAQGCANPFIADALNGHLRLRELPGQGGGVNVFRLRQSTQEHLGILDNLEARQYEVAADLLKVHLRLSGNQRPQAANRGSPPLQGMIRRLV